jgi:glycogen debranching enzyme
VDYEGLLHAGDEATQLTWMDASVNGRPVTPRHGCPVEINALWYNALAYAEELARRYGEANLRPVEIEEGCVRGLRDAFNRHFWLAGREYLADVWDYGHRDDSLRPNQIFAVSLPHPVLLEERWPRVVNRIRRNLLTPFGLRTLDPSHPDYRTVYFGRGEARDSAYHQGTVWPWLLGAYGDALLKTSEQPRDAAAELLAFLTPLFAKHMARAGLGSISEVFDASPPHYPNGCVAQAWSVAECLRLLSMLGSAAPDAFAAWEAAHFDQGSSLGEQPKVKTHP